MSLAWEKFQAAAITLSGSGRIKQRLAGAYLDNLAELDQKELPPEIQSEFVELCETLSKVPPTGNEGPVLATIRKMSRIEANACAQTIIAMYGTLARHDGVDQQQEPVHQLYAAES